MPENGSLKFNGIFSNVRNMKIGDVLLKFFEIKNGQKYKKKIEIQDNLKIFNKFRKNFLHIPYGRKRIK